MKKGLGVIPFRGVRFAAGARGLGRVLCPPYDVISREMARKLRRRKMNAIHLEAPAGGKARRYRRAARTWLRWIAKGTLVRDADPAYYVVEQRFRFRGRERVRTGVLAALGTDAQTAERVLRHERTLSRPKRDRAELLETLGVNTSPILAVYSDPRGRARDALRRIERSKPLSGGKDMQGVAYRLWRVDSGREVEALRAPLNSSRLLVADGHHRYEVARSLWTEGRLAGGEYTLACLVAEEDPGLIVEPTHRVAEDGGAVRAALDETVSLRPVKSLRALSSLLARSSSPYAFGLFDGGFSVAAPKRGDRGVPSRFGTDWLACRVLRSADPESIGYWHGVEDAVRAARSGGGLAFLLKGFSVSDVRKAVLRGGLLPQKSTYFYPKITAGLVFRELQ